MNIRPTLIGAQAQSKLDELAWTIQSNSAGSIQVTGPFFIMTASAAIVNGIDTLYTWADSTHIKWRFFNTAPGATLTIVTSGRSYVAATTQVAKANVADATVGTAVYSTQPDIFVGGQLASQQVITNLSAVSATASTSIAFPNALTLPPLAYWWTPIGPTGTLQTPVLFQTDLLYDIASPRSLGIAFYSLMKGYTIYNPTTPPQSGLMSLWRGSGIVQGVFSFDIVSAVSNPPIGYYLVVAGCKGHLSATDLTTFSVNTFMGPIVQNGVLWGPFYAGLANTPSSGCFSVWGAFSFPNWTPPDQGTSFGWGFGILPIADQAFVGTTLAVTNIAYCPDPVDFARQSQTLLGTATRTS